MHSSDNQDSVLTLNYHCFIHSLLIAPGQSASGATFFVPGGQAPAGAQYVRGLRMKRPSSSFLIHLSSLLTAETAKALVPSGLKQR